MSTLRSELVRRLSIRRPAPADVVTFLFFALLLFFGWCQCLRLSLHPAGTSLDDSWSAAYAHFLKHDFQAGVDYVFTYGPLGYFGTDVYDANLYWVRWAFEILARAALVAGLYRLFQSDAAPRRDQFLFYILGCCTLAIAAPSVRVNELTVFVLGCALLKDATVSLAAIAPTFLVIVVLSLIKFTVFIMSLVVVLLVVCRLAGSRRWRGAGRVVALYAGLLVLVWSALGQSPANLPRYLATSLSVATGYEAVAIEGPAAEVMWGGAALVVLGGLLLPYALRRPAAEADRRDWWGIGCQVALVAAIVFLQWKHAFTRHGYGNAAGFFSLVALLPFFLPAALPGYRWRFPVRAVGLCICFLIGFLGLHRTEGRDWLDTLGELPEQVRENLDRVASPETHRDHLEAAGRRVAAGLDLPAIRQAVGTAPVDIIGYEQTVVLANRLNWRPRPMFQGYTADTLFLAELNADHFRADSAPEFVLFKLQTLDARYPTLDDGPTLLVLLRRYRPVLVEKGYQLLKRAPDRAGEPGAGDVILERTVKFGEVIDARDWAGTVHTLSARIRPSLRGRLQRFVFKPSPVRLRVTTDESARPPTRVPVTLPHGRGGVHPEPSGREQRRVRRPVSAGRPAGSASAIVLRDHRRPGVFRNGHPDHGPAVPVGHRSGRCRRRGEG